MGKSYLRAIVSFVILGIAFVLSSCGGGGSLSSNPGDQPASVRISIDNQYKVVEPDGVTKIPISVSVYNGDGDLMKKVKVEISSDPDIGSFDFYSKNTVAGVATFEYTTPSYDVVKEYGVQNVKFNVSIPGYGVTGSSEIYFKMFTSKIVSVIPDNSTILPADNSITVPVTVYAYGGDGKPKGGVNIYASAYPNIGSFDTIVSSTSNDGIAKFQYTLPSKEDAEKLSANKVVLTFYNDDKTVSDNVTISFDNIELGNGIPAAIMISAQPSIIFTNDIALAPKVSQVTARVVDSSGKPIYTGYNVKFSILQAPNGTYVTPTDVPLVNGTAISNIVSGSVSGTVLLRASVENSSNVVASSSIVYVTTGQASKITLLGSGKIIAQDDNGTRSQKIFAFVKDANNAPVADGTVVSFYLNDSCGGMIQPQGITKDGIATAMLVYPSQCIWKGYSVSAETNGGQVSGTMNDSYPAVSPASITLSGPSAIGAGGGNITIIATLKDEGGNGLPIQGANVLFSSSVDNVTFAPSSSLTNSNGITYTTATIPPLDNTTTQRTITITGQSGSAIGSLVIQQQ